MECFRYNYILAVAEQQSFTKAAEKLYISQPSLSEYIKRVENTLGVQLFDRSIRPLQLTPAGAAFVATGQQIIHLQRRLKKQLEDLSNTSAKSLSIGFTPFRSTCILPQVLKVFSTQQPNITVSVMTAVTPHLLRACQEGKLDLFTANKPSLNRSIFRYRHIWDEPLLLAVPPSNPLNKVYANYRVPVEFVVGNRLDDNTIKRIPLNYFRSEIFLQSAHPQDLHLFLDHLCQRAGFTPSVLLQTQNIESIFAMTIAGLGCSFIPHSYIRFGNIAQHAAYYLVDDDFAKREFVLAFLNGATLSAAETSFISILQGIMRKTLP